MALKLYDLSQPFFAGVPLWPWPVMTDTEIYRVSFPERDLFPGDPKKGRDNKATTVIKTKFHASTHMDAPLHVLQGGLTIDKIPLSSCYGEGVIVDMRYLKKWDIIGAKDLDNAKPKIKKGDFVVVNTGRNRQIAMVSIKVGVGANIISRTHFFSNFLKQSGAHSATQNIGQQINGVTPLVKNIKSPNAQNQMGLVAFFGF